MFSFSAGLAFVFGNLLGVNGIIIGRRNSEPSTIDQIAFTVINGIKQFREHLENMPSNDDKVNIKSVQLKTE